jgi:TPR repeat protein
VCHARGLGVCADADAAFTAFERAADLGMADAQLQARTPAWPGVARGVRASRNTRAAGRNGGGGRRALRAQ